MIGRDDEEPAMELQSRVEPYVVTVRTNGIVGLVTIYPTTDRGLLPKAHRDDASPSDCGRALYVYGPSDVSSTLHIPTGLERGRVGEPE